MCGIIGYIGKEINVLSGIDSLKRLEYRGYDSAGIAWHNNQEKDIFCVKKLGRINVLEQEMIKKGLPQKSGLFIAHTRWATHGEPSDINAHPHSNCLKNIYLVHNGIIENHKQIKKFLLKKGHKFISETDSEVVVHLIEEFLKKLQNQKNNNKEELLEQAVRQSLKILKGAYAIVLISKDFPKKLIGARKSSPLLLGIGKDQYFLSSDASALIGKAQKVIYLDEGEVISIGDEGFSIFDLDNNAKEKKLFEIETDLGKIQKSGHPHFMLKEIMEQPECLKDSQRGRLIIEEGKAKLGGIENQSEKLRKLKRIIICGCGTAYYAGLIGEYMLEEYAGIPTEVEFGSEFRYRKPVLSNETAVLAISQSGETADTLAAINEAKEKGILTLGLVNAVGSTIARATDAGVYNHAGPEIGVASTKAFTSQAEVLALITLFLGRQRNLSLVMGERIAKEIKNLPQMAKQVLAQKKKIKEIAKKYKNYKHFLYLGRKYNYPVALEGALKLKEISYINAQGCAAGEMKHGTLALIDKNFPIFAICPKDSVYEKMISNLEEIKARQGKIIVITTKGNKDLKNLADEIIYIPKTLEMLTPIISVIPLQLFAYYTAVLKGLDPDKPRNLAKSVTVE